MQWDRTETGNWGEYITGDLESSGTKVVNVSERELEAIANYSEKHSSIYDQKGFVIMKVDAFCSKVAEDFWYL